MSATNHTPGPWFIQANGATYNLRRLDQPHHMILVNMNYIDQDEFEANVHLIAAAPQLLEACKAALKMLYRMPSGEDAPAFQVLRTAVAVAEGKDANS